MYGSTATGSPRQPHAGLENSVKPSYDGSVWTAGFTFCF